MPVGSSGFQSSRNEIRTLFSFLVHWSHPFSLCLYYTAAAAKTQDAILYKTHIILLYISQIDVHYYHFLIDILRYEC